MGAEPVDRGRLHASSLLVVDHLERVPERRTALLLHLGDDDPPAPTHDQVELVAARRVRSPRAADSHAGGSGGERGALLGSRSERRRDHIGDYVVRRRLVAPA